MNPSNAQHSEHARSKARLVAYAAGLLNEGTEQRLLEHLDACEECRDALAAMRYREPWDGGAGEHLPESLVATWPHSQRELVGLERDAVARHLSICDACREELKVLGHEPTLETVSATSRTAVGPRVIRLKSRRDWVRWAFAGWAVAATAAAIFLLFARPAGVPLGPGAQAGVSATLGVLPLPADNPAPSPTEPVLYTLAPGQRTVVLPLPHFSENLRRAKLDCLVTDVAGRIFAQASATYDATVAGSLVLPVDVGEPALPDGDYLLVVRATPEGRGEPESRTLVFRLAHTR